MPTACFKDLNGNHVESLETDFISTGLPLPRVLDMEDGNSYLFTEMMIEDGSWTFCYIQQA